MVPNALVTQRRNHSLLKYSNQELSSLTTSSSEILKKSHQRVKWTVRRRKKKLPPSYQFTISWRTANTLIFVLNL